MEKQIKRTILEQGRDWFKSDRKVILARVIQTWVLHLAQLEVT